MIKYFWRFPALECKPLENSLSDVVQTIQWEIIGFEEKQNLIPIETEARPIEPFGGFTLNSYWVSIVNGRTNLDPIININEFIPFDQITTGIAAQWVSAKVNITGNGGIYETIAADIERQKNPPIVYKQISTF